MVIPIRAGIALLLLGLAAVVAAPVQAQWSAEPGTTVRNAFGPSAGALANTCRGACGGGCPDSCERTVTFECADDAGLRRIVAYRCGTNTACRSHDDCLDACVENAGGANSKDCQASCDADVVARHGPIAAAAWLAGQGPYDGQIQFEYSTDSPESLQADYVCPTGSKRQCNGAVGCLTSNGELFEPLFGGYHGAQSNAMRVSLFRAGLVCDDHVCTYGVDIPVTGRDMCAGERCTRFGVEFDYSNANPAAPLECTTMTLGQESDFINTLLKQGGDAIDSRAATDADESPAVGKKEDGMAELAGLFGKIIASGKSTEDIDVSITPLDKDGNPIVSQRVGTQPSEGPPPVPRAVDLPSDSGHLLIPMYQLAKGLQPGSVTEKRVKCSHLNQPVLEATFRLRGS